MTLTRTEWPILAEVIEGQMPAAAKLSELSSWSGAVLSDVTTLRQPSMQHLASVATGVVSASRLTSNVGLHSGLPWITRQAVIGPGSMPSAFTWIASATDFSASADISEPPPWVLPVMRRVEQLLSLPDDWDAYGASRVRPENAYRALALAFRVMQPGTPPPALVPTGDGGIQLEWHRAGLDVEVLVSGSEEDGLYVHDLATGEEWEGDPEDGFEQFQLASRLEGAATPVAE